MAAHVRLKNEFTKDKKYHNIMSWLIWWQKCMYGNLSKAQKANDTIKIQEETEEEQNSIAWLCSWCIWTASSEFGTYRLCEQRRFRRACASAQSRQNLRCSLIQAVSQEEPSYRKPDPWLLWMAGHAQLKFVMTERSKTQIRLVGLILPKHIWNFRC